VRRATRQPPSSRWESVVSALPAAALVIRDNVKGERSCRFGAPCRATAQHVIEARSMSYC